MSKERARRFQEVAGKALSDNWEESRLWYMLKSLGLLPSLKKALVEDRAFSDRPVTFDDFHAVVPDFPVRLFADRLNGMKLHLAYNASLPVMFSKFSSTPMYKAYRRAAGKCKDSYVGVVMPRKGMRQGLIVHDNPSLMSDTEFPRFEIITPGGAKVTVQPFSIFVSAVARKWAWA